MKLKEPVILLIFTLICSIVLNFAPLTTANTAETSTPLYFGVDVAFESLADTIQIIDEVSSYTNLFIIGCYGPITQGKWSTNL